VNLRHVFVDPTLLQTALTHPTWTNEHPADPHNQRLELLGDAVLKLIVTDLLLAAHPTAAEGVLSERRAALVGTEHLAGLATALGIGEAMRFGGSEVTTGPSKPSILEDALEAVIGAIYEDGGLEAARAELAPLFTDAVGQPPRRPPKSELQELLQKRFGELPRYSQLDATGPDHARWYRVAVYVRGKPVAEGEGKTLKAAEAEAARAALVGLEDGAWKL